MQLSNLFICGFKEASLEKDTADKLLELNPAGIILFDNNIENKTQLKKLINDLKDLLGENLLISVDQEGGKVERLRKVASSLPSLKALGIAAQEDITYIDEHTELFSRDLLELNFNLVFAPCLDLNTEGSNPIIGTRSLGADPKTVSKQAARLIQKLSHYPILNCAKHFPGHGAASLDSHFDLPFIDLSNEKDYEAHLAPFKTAIENDVDMIMTAHVVYKLRALLEENKHKSSKSLAASINPDFVEGLLKNLLGFKGLCVTDEITMKALAQFGDYKRLCELMIKAGNDLIIWNTNLDEALAVEKSSPSCHFSKSLKDRIENSIEKRQRLIDQRLKPNAVVQELDLERRKYLENRMLEIAERGILVNSQENLNPDYILLFKHPKLEEEAIKAAFPEAKILFFSAETVPNEDIEKVSRLDEISIAKEASILIMSFQINRYPELITALHNFRSRHSRILHVECDSDFRSADLLLRGANLVHFQALRNLLKNTKN